ncbi:unnamed protein product, partial [Amoebophrya sp. A25]|eukprot:GSA25T00013204001.1
MPHGQRDQSKLTESMLRDQNWYRMQISADSSIVAKQHALGEKTSLFVFYRRTRRDKESGNTNRGYWVLLAVKDAADCGIKQQSCLPEAESSSIFLRDKDADFADAAGAVQDWLSSTSFDSSSCTSVLSRRPASSSVGVLPAMEFVDNDREKETTAYSSTA